MNYELGEYKERPKSRQSKHLKKTKYSVPPKYKNAERSDNIRRGSSQNSHKALKPCNSNLTIPHPNTYLIVKRSRKKPSDAKLQKMQARIIDLTNKNIRLKNKVSVLENKLRKSKVRKKGKVYIFDQSYSLQTVENKENISLMNQREVNVESLNESTIQNIGQGPPSLFNNDSKKNSRCTSQHKTFEQESNVYEDISYLENLEKSKRRSHHHKQSKIPRGPKIRDDSYSSKSSKTKTKTEGSLQSFEAGKHHSRATKEYNKELKKLRKEVELLKLEENIKSFSRRSSNPTKFAAKYELEKVDIKEERTWNSNFRKIMNDLDQLHSDVDNLQFESTHDDDSSEYYQIMEIE
ncbi:unnamed protein product [Moneuplotes crassus]|uniref:Uncharacterized protein n=1 Tax=Euplotes crassus TaxID=5936 RepID=A0AAD1UJY1_EUPCR|nr:unnamed protein product [Moneuplotes crassus]